MKRILILIFIASFTVALQAQKSDRLDYYKNLETTKELNLTDKQITEIKSLKQQAESKFTAIGKDQTLTGQEKRHQKRDVAIQLKENIKNVLTTEQLKTWEEKYGKIENRRGLKNTATDHIDKNIDALKEKYESEVKSIENNSALTKEQIENQKKILKEKYKKEKDILKDKKNDIKEIF